ncbi:hypothetical protein GC163_04905 [bacterium]|nr:hypothetical protein [bacterium]
MQHHRAWQHPRHSRRHGLTTPLVMLALLVAMCGLALILDRMWLEATRLELNTAAEAAALAGARDLASDQRLLPEITAKQLEDEATQSAVFACWANRAAGQPVVVSEADVQFSTIKADSSVEVVSNDGSLVDNGLVSQVDDETELPNRILVQAHRTRFRGNPVALFISQLTNQPYGDAVGIAAAKIDPRIVGVRPVSGSVVPALPLAIWKVDPTGQRSDTWQVAIEQRLGRDDYGYDTTTDSVTSGGDGIPELTLTSARRDGPAIVVNLQLLDIGTAFDEKKLSRQITQGWLAEDLATWNGEFRLSTDLNSTDVITLPGLPFLESADRDALDQIVGSARVAMLYDSAATGDSAQVSQINCSRLVAIRVLQVSDQDDGSCQIVVQPAVLATRTAIVDASQDLESIDHRSAYLYRLELTR